MLLLIWRSIQSSVQGLLSCFCFDFSTRYVTEHHFLFQLFIMMLQHQGFSLSEISASAFVPCLSPPGTLTLEDFTNFTPLVKEELRYAIQHRRLSNGLSTDIMSDCASSSSDRPSEATSVKRLVRMSTLAAYCNIYSFSVICWPA